MEKSNNEIDEECYITIDGRDYLNHEGVLHPYMPCGLVDGCRDALLYFERPKDCSMKCPLLIR
jgi:hypothetical protein